MSIRVPLFEIRDDVFRAEVESAALSVLRSHHYLMGPALKNFEHALALYQGAQHAIGVANGTDALAIALLALGVKPGDRVAVVANAGSYGSFAAVQIGAIPVVVDIDPATHQIDPKSFANVVAKTEISAVIVTHLYGLMAPVADIAKYGIPVIEDVAQAMGAEMDNKKAGSFGNIATFSFYPTKNLGAAGDAGALTTNDAMLAENIKSLRQYGWRDKYRAEIAQGRNSRMDEIQAAILNAKIKYLDGWNEARRKIWMRYKASGMNMIGHHDKKFTAHLCVAQVKDAGAWQKKLNEAGIATAVHYPVMDYEQPALKSIIETPVSLTGTKNIKGSILTLPCFPEMRLEEIEYVCKHLN